MKLFPSTPLIDSFNRANEDLVGASGWDCKTGTVAQLKIVSNQVLGTTSTTSQSLLRSRPYGDCEAWLTIATLPGSGNTIGPVICQDPSTAASSTGKYGYFFLYNQDTGFQLSKDVNTVITQLGSTVTGITAAAGDKIGIRKIGTEITCWFMTASGGWVNLLTVFDSTFSYGYLGIRLRGTTAAADDFGGGAVRYPRDYAKLSRLTRACTSQLATEVLIQAPSSGATAAKARVSQVATEVLIQAPSSGATSAKARTSQFAVEVLIQTHHNAIVSQFAVEILIPSPKTIAPSFAGTSSLTVALTALQKFTVTFAGTSSFLPTVTTNSGVTQNFTATFAGTSTLTATLIPLQRISLTLAGTSSFSATVTPTAQISPTFAGTSTFNASVITHALLTPTFAGTSTFATSLAAMGHNLIVTFAGTSTLSFPFPLKNPGGWLSQVSLEAIVFPTAGAELSQLSLETVVFPSAGGELSQVTGEVVRTGNADGALSQITVESVKQPLSAARLAQLSQVTVEVLRVRGNVNVWKRYGPTEIPDTAAFVDEEIAGTVPGSLSLTASISASSAMSASVSGGKKQIGPIPIAATSAMSATVRDQGIHAGVITATSLMFAIVGGGKKKITSASISSTSSMSAILKKTTPFFVTLSGGTGEGDTLSIVVTP